MKTRLIAGETIVRESAANHQRGIETVGGRLYLTSQRLFFESHAFNIQSGPTIIALQDIVNVEPAWTRFLNLIPMMPNSIKVATRDGQEHTFVVFGRGEWMRVIKAQSAR